MEENPASPDHTDNQTPSSGPDLRFGKPPGSEKALSGGRPPTVQNQTQTPSPSDSKLSKFKRYIPKSKLTLIFLIVNLIIFLGLLTVFAYSKLNPVEKNQSSNIAQAPSPTPDPTADWETYYGKEFSFKYPAYMQLDSSGYVTDMSLAPDGKIAEENTLYYQEGGIGGSGGVFIQQGIDIGTFIERRPTVVTQYTKQYREGFRNAKKIKVDGHEAYKVTENEEGGGYTGKQINVFIIKDDEIFIFGTNIFPSNREDYIDLFDQILSTFKFTDYSLAIDTSDWKTYVNNETGYSLKYPQDWKIIYPCHKGSILTDSLCFVSSDYIASTSPALTEKGSEITLFKGELIPFSPETVNCDSYSDNNSCEAKNYGNFTVLFKQDNKNPDFREITIQNNSNYKMIGLYVKYNPQSKEITNNIFNSMLSTFRFD